MLLFWDKRFRRERSAELRLTYYLFTKFSRKGARPPDFGRSDNPNSTWEGRLCPSHYYSPSRFSNLPPSLNKNSARNLVKPLPNENTEPTDRTYAAILGQTFSPRPTVRAPFNLLSFHEIFAHKISARNHSPIGAPSLCCYFWDKRFRRNPRRASPFNLLSFHEIFPPPNEPIGYLNTKEKSPGNSKI